MRNPPTTLINHNQRVIDQLALENLNNLKAEKFQREKSLVLNYLRRKLTRVAHLDDSVINRMESGEFDRVLKKAKVSHYLILGFKFMSGFLIGFGIIIGILLIKNINALGVPILMSSVIALLIYISFLLKSSCYCDWGY